MILSPPTPWGNVRDGMQVVYMGAPRTVLAIVHGTGSSTVYLEGLPPLDVNPADYVQPVTLDDTDAAAILQAGGLSPEVIRDLGPLDPGTIITPPPNTTTTWSE